MRYNVPTQNLLITGVPGTGKTEYYIRDLFNNNHHVIICQSIEVLLEFKTRILQMHGYDVPFYYTKPKDHPEYDRTAVVTDDIKNHLIHNSGSFLMTHAAYEMVDNKYFEDSGFTVVHEELPNILDERTGLQFDEGQPLWEFFNISGKLTDPIELTSKGKNSTRALQPTTIKAIRALKNGKKKAHRIYNSKNGHDLSILITAGKHYLTKTPLIIIGHKCNENPTVKNYVDNYDTKNIELTKKYSSMKDVTLHYFDEEKNTKKHKGYYGQKHNIKIYQDRINYIENNTVGPVGYTCNNDDVANLTFPDGWVNIPSNCLGSNKYSHLKNIVIMGIFNMSSPAYARIKDAYPRNTKEDVDYLRNGTAQFQAIMRSALRVDVNQQQEIKLFLMDEHVATTMYNELEEYNYNLKTPTRIIGFDTHIIKEVETKPKKPQLNKNEHTKAANIVALAKAKFYSSIVNATILTHASNKERFKIKEMKIWNKVSARGLFK